MTSPESIEYVGIPAFSVDPPKGRSLVEHVTHRLTDWLLTIAPTESDTILCSPVVAAWIDCFPDFVPDANMVVDPNRPFKIGRWHRRFDVYVDIAMDKDPEYGTFAKGLVRHTNGMFRLAGITHTKSNREGLYPLQGAL